MSGCDLRPIPGFPGYLVSMDGRVWSKHRSKFIGGRFDSYGYRTFGLVDTDGVRRTISAHQLVVRAFLGPVSKGKEINHIDGDKTNNHLSNLEVVSHLDNIRHSWRIGLWTKKFGEDTTGAKLTSIQVCNIRHLHRSGVKQKHLAVLYGMSQSGISRITTGDTRRG